MTPGTMPAPAGAPVAPVTPDLTPREAEVLRFLRQGKQNQAIAAALGIDINTVKTFVSALLRKFEVETRTQLVVTLHQYDLIQRRCQQNPAVAN